MHERARSQAPRRARFARFHDKPGLRDALMVPVLMLWAGAYLAGIAIEWAVASWQMRRPVQWRWLKDEPLGQIECDVKASEARRG